jgi:rhamnosyltransferase
MNHTPPVSVVMRSKNDGAIIGATLKMLYNQDYPGGVEVIHIDSGSTDNTVAQIQARRPGKLIQIRAEDYVPGVVLNCGMREARSAWVVFLNSDAEPANRRWLSGLLDATKSGAHLGAAFGRQVPRPDCRAVYARDYDRCFGPQRESVRWDHFFSMVSCIVNRAAWEEHPFREDLQYSEDEEWSRRIKAHGWAIGFAPDSIAIHSHNYTFPEAYKREYGDTFAGAATKTQVRLRPTDWIFGVAFATMKDAAQDLGWCRQQRRLREWPHAVGVRLAQRLGKIIGFRKGRSHYHGTTKQDQ